MSVNTVCGMSWHQMCGGKFVSVPFKMEMKCASKVWIALSARFLLCMHVLTSWQSRSLARMLDVSSLEISLSSLWRTGLIPASVRRLQHASCPLTGCSALLLLIGSAGMALESQSCEMKTQLLPLLLLKGNTPGRSVHMRPFNSSSSNALTVTW